MSGTRPAAPPDTIFAVASGAGRSAIAVLRISGPACGAVVSRLCTLPTPRTAKLRILRDQAGDILDRAVVLWLPAPASYTGEDSAELHVHGGLAVLDGVVGALMENGARPAEPGEFTRRAFLAGKLDLLEAEAVADLIGADTSEQRAQALRQLGGEQSRMVQDWASRLVHSLALQEALIDFSDEELPDVEANLLGELRRLQTELRQNLASSGVGERLRRGLVFVITGAPNVGKSSLLNSLVGRDAAIVTAIPGTTRDLVAVETVIAGVPVTLIDTAGIRETDDEIEAEGVRRARAQAADADLVIEIVDTTAYAETKAQPNSLLVVNKVDLAPVPPGQFGISVRTGEGLDRLSGELAASVGRLAGVGGSASFNRARHVVALREADTAVAAALDCSHAEMRAEELRLAVQALGRISGQVDAEDMLDVIFSTFCIGK